MSADQTIPQDIWSLVWGKPQIDPDLLLTAIEHQLADNHPIDERTKILIRDSTDALKEFLGKDRMENWISSNKHAQKLRDIRSEAQGKAGFPFLKDRLMKRTDPETVMQFLRELGVRSHSKSRLEIGGSIALMLRGLLSRATEDIDIVDEVPSAIRNQRELIDELQSRYGLALTHFQSHYLPTGWKSRAVDFGTFGSLSVYLAATEDIFIGKLFSPRVKDLDDLRMLLQHVDKAKLAEHYKLFGQELAKDEKLRTLAGKNWYILFGEELPGGA